MRSIKLPSLVVLFALLLIIAAPRLAAAQVTTVGGKPTPTSPTVAVKVGADGTVQTSGTVTVGGNAITAANPLPTRLYDGASGAMGTTVNPVVTNVRLGYVKTGAPTFSASASTVSAAATGLTAGACYRVACTATVYFRSGAGTPTALTTDNPFFGPAVEKVCLPSTDTALAFVTTAGTGTCAGTVLAVTP